MQSTTVIEPSELGQEARGRMGHWAGLAVALALFAVGVVALESLPLAPSPPSPGALARSGQAQRGLGALPVAARGVVARTLGADDRRWAAHGVAGGFALGNRDAPVQASFSRRNVTVRSGTVSWSLGLRG